MTRESIIEQVNAILAEEFEIDQDLFTPNANVKETLSLDSLSLVDLVAIIQHTYKIKIPVTDLQKIQTFNNLYDYIESHFGQNALAEAFDCGVNELPLSMVLSWYEQKAVCILLTLLHLGIKNIKLGPTLPAFISPNILNYLVDNYGIAPITTPEADLAEILG